MSIGLSLLSSIIRNGAGNQLLSLEDRFLTLENEQTAIGFARDYYRSYREVPTPDLVRENTGVRLPTGDGAVSFYIDELHDRLQWNLIREGYEEIRERVADGRPAPVVESMEGLLRRVRRNRTGGSLIDIHEGMTQVIDRLRAAQRMGGISGVATPWPSMNEQSGGYQDGDLITFVGRMGMGKTAMLLAQAESAYDQGYSVLFVTTEMIAEQISRRWMALKYGLDPQHLKKGTVSTRLMRRMEVWQAELLGRERFRLLSLGTGAQLSQVEAVIDEIDPDIVFIDGAYFFRPASGGNNMKLTERVTAVFDEMKQQTIDTNKPYVVTTQLNRSSGKGGKDASLETIGLSDAIGWHSSIVVAVKGGPTENPLQSRELEFLKGREGEQGSFAINFKFKPPNFSELTPEELAAIADALPMNDPAINTNWT